ncbi:Inner centromere protein [Collichthys lucidus]|uniref:Inner centromere protein n=1 Tax=Collichthys lucidus TaxID=240159 RepID=A0A4U5UG84_COLLU|nr:Inner centromere protein [Collichthys lucidus]
MSTPVGKGGGLNVTVDVEQSPQSYVITPKGGNKPVMSKSAEDYGMDQNSDDSTDDESAPRKTYSVLGRRSQPAADNYEAVLQPS